MHYLKLYSSVLLAGGLLTGGVVRVSAQTLSACLETGKMQYTQKQFPQARSTFEKCLEMDEENVEAHLSLAGVLCTQEQLPDAKIHF